MKRFIIKISIFFLILLFLDLGLGSIFKLYNFSNGQIYKIHSVMTKEVPDLLILGSSRASHHYVPAILRDSLNFSVYNAGIDGQGTTISYGLLKGIEQRQSPKYILCEITPEFDLYSEDALPALNKLYPYLYVDSIENLVTSFDSNEKWKLKSNAYKLNSVLLDLISSILFRAKTFEDGYQPLYGYIEKDVRKKKTSSVIPKKIDKNKERWLRNLLKEAESKNINLIFAISPKYEGGDLSFYSDEIAIIKEYGRPIINHLNDTAFTNHSDYFQDEDHFNDGGAKIYTSSLAEELKMILDKVTEKQ